MRLLDLQKQWTTFIRQGKIEDAHELYWSQMHPTIENDFCKKYKEFRDREYDWLIIPAGLTERYYVLLIKALRPKNVYFLCTNTFYNEFLDNIVAKTGLSRKQYIADIVDYEEMDLATVYSEIKKRNVLFKDAKTVVDLTRGKRIMSTGAGIMAAFFNFDIVYIDEDWVDDIKRGLPGTEKMVEARNPLYILGDLTNSHAENLFNLSSYRLAAETYHQLEKRVVDPREYIVKALIAEAYDYWDGFNYTAASVKLNEALLKMNQYNIKAYKEKIETNKMAIDELSIMHQKKSLDIMKDPRMALHLAVDLFENAARRHSVNRNDDALIRLYRLLELVSQHRLANAYGMDTAYLDVKKIIKKIADGYRTLSKDMFGVSMEISEEMGLKNGHLLLYVLEDDIWRNVSKSQLKHFFGTLRTRDQSIIAHGLEFISVKAYNQMSTFSLDFLSKLAKMTETDLDTIMKQHRFIKFEQFKKGN